MFKVFAAAFIWWHENQLGQETFSSMKKVGREVQEFLTYMFVDKLMNRTGGVLLIASIIIFIAALNVKTFAERLTYDDDLAGYSMTESQLFYEGKEVELTSVGISTWNIQLYQDGFAMATNTYSLGPTYVFEAKTNLFGNRHAVLHILLVIPTMIIFFVFNFDKAWTSIHNWMIIRVLKGAGVYWASAYGLDGFLAAMAVLAIVESVWDIYFDRSVKDQFWMAVWQMRGGNFVERFNPHITNLEQFYSPHVNPDRALTLWVEGDRDVI